MQQKKKYEFYLSITVSLYIIFTQVIIVMQVAIFV